MPKIPKIIIRVRNTIEKFNMLRRGWPITVAISGGPDSVFLLMALDLLRKDLELVLSAVHVNHLTRGEEGDADSAFCRDLCESLKVPFLEIVRNVPELAQAQGFSLEEAGRIVRLEAYNQAAQEFSSRRIATGHTADDQAETVLMKMLAGTGKEGLAGIYPVYERKLIRPLIEIKREEITAFLAKSGQNFRLDSTNQDTSFFRNRVRHLLIPFIKKNFNPRISEALCRMASIFRQEADFLREHTSSLLDLSAQIGENQVRINAKKLVSQPPYILKHLLREAVKVVKGDLSDVTFEHTENLFSLLEKPSGSSIILPGGLKAEKEYQYLLIKKSEEEILKPPAVALDFPGEHFPEGWGVMLSGVLTDRVFIDYKTQPHEAFLDADKLGDGGFILRTRKKGDRFWPLGAPGEKKLKDFLIDKKIPRRLRETLPILEKNGEIAWVAGLRPSERYRITRQTRRVLELRIEKVGL